MSLEEKLLIALFTGCMALLGGIIGGFISRYTELEKWRRSNIGPSTELFMKLMAQARLETTDIIYTSGLEEPRRGEKITLAYMPALDQARVVRLYMRKGNKDHFQSLVKEIYSLHAGVNLGQERLATIDSKLQEIQDILERETANKVISLGRIFRLLRSLQMRR